jgi:MFS family permease
MGAGSLCGAVIASLSQRARWRTLFLGAYAFFIMQLGFAFSRFFPMSLVFMALSGFSIILFYTSANTGVQTRVPDALRGRVMGVYMAVNVGTAPLGNLAVGWTAEHYSAPVALAAGCLIALVVLVAATVWLLPRRKQPNLSLGHGEGYEEIRHGPTLVKATG